MTSFRIRGFYITTVTLLLLVRVDVRADGDRPSEIIQHAILGSWTLTSATPPYDGKYFSFTFRPRGKLLWTEDEIRVDGDYVINDVATPHAISFLYEEELAPWEGIIKLHGQELWICISADGLPAPKTFEGNDKQQLYRFKRGL